MNTQIDRIRTYLADVSAQWKTGAATELSYRAALAVLLADLIPRVTVVNEPAHIACGAPDLLVRSNGATRAPVGYVETKDIGDGDLDGNGRNKEQFDRYKQDLDNIVFTDYLDFRFYTGGTRSVASADGTEAVPPISSIRIAEVVGGKIVPAPDETLERFAALLAHFGSATPRRITSPARLAALMAGKARLLARAIAAALAADPDGATPLAQQRETFRKMLIHDLTDESFADVYAQTITYGLFAARLHDTTPEDFSRAEAATLLPRTNPLLRKMFLDLANDLDPSVEWIVDDLVALFAATDLTKILKDYGKSTERTDPILHFYEDFLTAYNPALRKQRGVWYTPDPVVNFIVRAVDRTLVTKFDLPDGLADASKTTVEVKNDAAVSKRDKPTIRREMHRVQVLDPSAGTGTFIAAVIKLIHAKFANMAGMWPGYVRDHLLPRLNGFEILMASYAMAHLKIDQLLANTGYVHESNERLRVFLTNSLEEWDESTGTLWAAALAQEAQEANYIKRDCPVMVVMGNPPYSVSSANKGAWIQGLIADYKKDLNERKINLDDDYIKFIRLGQHYIDRNGSGILALITNNSFLDGITHRQMRKTLLRSFDEIYILNLHGNARKKETCPDGSKDENVFDIMQGVSINIFVKGGKCLSHGERGEHGEEISREVEKCRKVNCSGSGAESQIENSQCSTRSPWQNDSLYTSTHLHGQNLARVHYADLYGTRESKYAFLETHSLDTTPWQELELREPYYFFVPKDFSLEEEYKKGFAVDELMPVYNSGIQTKCDEFCLHDTEAQINAVIGDVRSLSLSELRQKYSHIHDGPAWTLERAQADVLRSSVGKVIRIQYKPFDFRFTYYTGNASGFLGRPRANVGNQALHPNLFLSTMRQISGTKEECVVLATETLIADRTLYSTNGTPYLFPLYLYSEKDGVVEKKANLNPEVVAKIGAVCGRDCPNRVSFKDGSSTQDAFETNASTSEDSSAQPSTFNLQPEEVFHYVYAVLHTPSYRSRYREFLKVDFPRIPYPASGEQFHRLAAIGAELVEVHLLKASSVRQTFSPVAAFPVAGENRVEKVTFQTGGAAGVRALPDEDSTVDLDLEPRPHDAFGTNASTGRVYVNATQYFDNVPQSAWEFFIGGYQPAQKWLKDRKGRVLSSDDIVHYKSIILALLETRRLMDAADAASSFSVAKIKDP